jgi:hypothetical protein
MIPPESTPEDRSLQGRIGAHESWARTPDRARRTAPGRAAMLARFEREVDPTNELPVAERAQRAEHLRRAYFCRLALRSATVRARRSRGAAKDAGLAAELRRAADALSTDDDTDRDSRE